MSGRTVHQVTIQCPEDLKALQSALERRALQGDVLVRCTNWSIIPMENLIAARGHDVDVTIIAESATARDAEVLLGALEIGVDGIFLPPDSSADELQRTLTLLARLEASESTHTDRRPDVVHSSSSPSDRVVLTESEILRVESLPGLSDRVCVDTTSTLRPNEGLCVGNFCRAQFLVQAEVDASDSESVDYIASRPFRVNAGALHLYVLSPGGKTAYLSELRSGSEVLVVSGDGSTRTAVVGRCKIERRPVVQVEARDAAGDVHSVILQNAETVKLCRREGPPVSVTELRPGMRVWVARQEATGRHTGIAVQESINEI